MRYVMIEEEDPEPTNEQIEALLEDILFPSEEIDEETALLILQRAGINEEAFLQQFKLRLQEKAQKMLDEGHEVPQGLRKVIEVL
jgi:hypothetical protein